MRITFDIPDDVYHAARSMAAARADETKPFPCFAIAEPGPPITLEQTFAAEDEP